MNKMNAKELLTMYFLYYESLLNEGLYNNKGNKLKTIVKKNIYFVSFFHL